MDKIVMPEMPDFSKMTLYNKIRIKCEALKRSGYCKNRSCEKCALYGTGNYKKWKAQQPKNELIQWPMRDRDNFFVMPRVSMNAMPIPWKKKMLKLLIQIVTMPIIEKPEYDFRVSVTKNGKYIKMPDIFKRR